MERVGGYSVHARDLWRSADQNHMQSIREIWSKVLGTPVSAVDANFFDLGGHSLLVMRLQEHLQAVSGVEIPIEDLYEHTTVRAQVALLSRLARADAVGVLGADGDCAAVPGADVETSTQADENPS